MLPRSIAVLRLALSHPTLPVAALACPSHHGAFELRSNFRSRDLDSMRAVPVGPLSHGERRRLEARYPLRLGSYLLVGPFGAGGMGEVCLAVMLDESGEKVDLAARLCVVKRRLGEDQDVRQELGVRFRQEIEISRRLQHEVIARTLAVGEEDGERFLVQEFVPGVDLAEVEKIDLGLAAYVVCQVAEALAYMHDFEGMGLVHRDVAPANIRLSATGEVKLLDFGLATSPKHAGLTAPGGAWGRPAYAAPETRFGRPDRRGDVYSLGVVLGELAGGRLPGIAPRGATLPPALDAVIAKATALAPQDRFATALELREALSPWTIHAEGGRAQVRALVETNADYAHQKRVVELMLEDARPGLANMGGAVPKRRGAVTLVLACLAVVAIVGAIGAKRWTGTGRGEGSRAERQATIAEVEPPRVRAGLPTRDVRPAAPVVTADRPRGTDFRSPPRARPATTPITHAIAPEPPPAAEREAQPDAGFPSLVAAAALRQAQVRFDAGELEQAEAQARRAVDLGAGTQAQLLLGSILLAGKKFVRAREEFMEVLRADPSNGVARSRLAEVEQAIERLGGRRFDPEKLPEVSSQETDKLHHRFRLLARRIRLRIRRRGQPSAWHCACGTVAPVARDSREGRRAQGDRDRAQGGWVRGQAGVHRRRVLDALPAGARARRRGGFPAR